MDLAGEATDPDGDGLRYSWFCYGEAGTFTMAAPRTGRPLEIEDAERSKAWFKVPTRRVMPPGTGTIHIILAVTDTGTPPLTRYQRVIVDVRA